MASEKGFTAVKFYGSMNRNWLIPAIAEAKKLNLHVHGHVPAGMRPAEAIAAGYDEITHINMVMMQAMPDDVVKVSNGIQRFEGPSRYARNVDIGAEPIKSLIEESVSAIQEGADTATTARGTVSRTVDAISQLNTIMNEIATASAEQGNGIDQVNTAISQMDQVTQQNAALVEQASASSAAMSEQAAKLTREVEVFVIA